MGRIYDTWHPIQAFDGVTITPAGFYNHDTPAINNRKVQCATVALAGNVNITAGLSCYKGRHKRQPISVGTGSRWHAYLCDMKDHKHISGTSSNVGTLKILSTVDRGVSIGSNFRVVIEPLRRALLHRRVLYHR